VAADGPSTGGKARLTSEMRKKGEYYVLAAIDRQAGLNTKGDGTLLPLT